MVFSPAVWIVRTPGAAHWSIGWKFHAGTQRPNGGACPSTAGIRLPATVRSPVLPLEENIRGEEIGTGTNSPVK